MKRIPDEFKVAVHLGEVLQEMLDDLGVSQSKLARHVKVDPSKINEICRGRRGISAEMALILSRALGTSVAVWMNLQKAWELSQADRSVVARVRPLSRVA